MAPGTSPDDGPLSDAAATSPSSWSVVDGPEPSPTWVSLQWGSTESAAATTAPPPPGPPAPDKPAQPDARVGGAPAPMPDARPVGAPGSPVAQLDARETWAAACMGPENHAGAGASAPIPAIVEAQRAEETTRAKSRCVADDTLHQMARERSSAIQRTHELHVRQNADVVARTTREAAKGVEAPTWEGVWEQAGLGEGCLVPERKRRMVQVHAPPGRRMVQVLAALKAKERNAKL